MCTLFYLAFTFNRISVPLGLRGAAAYYAEKVPAHKGVGLFGRVTFTGPGISETSSGNISQPDRIRRLINRESDVRSVAPGNSKIKHAASSLSALMFISK